MRQFILSCISMILITCASTAAYAQCSIGDTNDHTCSEGAAPAQEAAPATPAGTAIQSAPTAPPIGTSDVIDYSRTSETVQRDVQPNLTQETDPIEPGECVQRTIPPNSTTSIPFTYGGGSTNMNVPEVDGQGVTRMFVSSMPGYDPLNRLAPGAGNDFYSPCHAQANLPDICDESSCVPDPNNENTINIRDAETVAADPTGNAGQCPLVPGTRYYVNIQNQGSSPICTSVGNGTSCPPCYVDGGGWGGGG